MCHDLMETCNDLKHSKKGVSCIWRVREKERGLLKTNWHFKASLICHLTDEFCYSVPSSTATGDLTVNSTLGWPDWILFELIG